MQQILKRFIEVLCLLTINRMCSKSIKTKAVFIEKNYESNFNFIQNNPLCIHDTIFNEFSFGLSHFETTFDTPWYIIKILVELLPFGVYMKINSRLVKEIFFKIILPRFQGNCSFTATYCPSHKPSAIWNDIIKILLFFLQIFLLLPLLSWAPHHPPLQVKDQKSCRE